MALMASIYEYNMLLIYVFDLHNFLHSRHVGNILSGASYGVVYIFFNPGFAIKNKCLGKNNFYPMKIVDTWNNLPANVAEAPTIGSFKRRLTKYRRSLVIS